VKENARTWSCAGLLPTIIHHPTMTNPYDQRAHEPQHTICPDCGEDLEWHDCGAVPSERTLRIRKLNDEFRSNPHGPLAWLAGQHLVITKGVAARGLDFASRALDAVRTFDNFAPENDPYGEHDLGSFEIDGFPLIWKIDYYDTELDYGSPDPAQETRRVLTILLAEEY
jgi:Protein of unknown function (DUF3768)